MTSTARPPTVTIWPSTTGVASRASASFGWRGVGERRDGRRACGAGDVVGVGVRVEDADEFGVVLVEDRLVLVDVVRRVEDDGLAVRDKNVRKTAFPRTRDLNERAVEIDRNLRVPMDAAPAVHPVGERHGVVAQLAEDVRRRLRDDALAADGDDLRVIGEIGEGRLGPFRVCGQLRRRRRR